MKRGKEEKGRRLIRRTQEKKEERRGSRRKEGEKCCNLHSILGRQTTADNVFVIKIENMGAEIATTVTNHLSVSRLSYVWELR